MKKDVQVALFLFSLVGALGAIERYYKHPTYGNGVRALVAAAGAAIS